MEIFGLDDWLAWFLLGIGLLLTELLIGFTFYAAPVALGAFAAAIVAAFGDAIEPQLVAFILGSAASLLVLRPLVKKHLLPPPPDKRSNVQKHSEKRSSNRRVKRPRRCRARRLPRHSLRHRRSSSSVARRCWLA